jgi:hypothetical protein
MRKLDRLPPALQSTLTDFQIAWLGIQARAMQIPCERLTSTILNEWLSNHPEMLHGRHDPKEVIRHALGDFIRCNAIEFLPVRRSDSSDQDE